MDRPVEEHWVPLVYPRQPKESMRRFAIVDPSVPVPPVRRGLTRSGVLNTAYYEPEIEYTHPERGNRPYRGGPRVEANPNVIEPFTVAFADFHHPTPDSTYIDYVHTRQRGQGHARRLIEEIAAQHPEHSLDFGKVMHPAIANLAENLMARGRNVRYVRYF
jgi:GNAT superfamily N-acetyltransferase